MTFLTVPILTSLSGTCNNTAHNSNVIMLNIYLPATLEQAGREAVFTHNPHYAKS
ncbi:Putative uncharacterized protein [Moritella viscosa]|uniref:Uncharacterized protein n=1 Tax=Moritella viscosa TaxID=80854 RepID=A0A1L0C2I7_9GAMM|nr:Putative uncharacterized protein [Moritella viscosa]SGZ13340.1 Putative uncharacterized protein [Moritella viscosa]SGZ13431.1 Putative uncharacterized protein [Moritella viscosa]SHO13294.1 Putative uncharacterized protein [Moritella viscosa]SHO13322.1 Putative uncharacterized protein [Moritella viscosa]